MTSHFDCTLSITYHVFYSLNFINILPLHYAPESTLMRSTFKKCILVQVVTTFVDVKIKIVECLLQYSWVKAKANPLVGQPGRYTKASVEVLNYVI